MEIIKTDGVDIRSWCPEIEAQALEQMKLIAKLPYVRECCLMPDGHWGENCCIGGVVACEDVVVPSFVGQDAGCGMAAVRTDILVDQLTKESQGMLFKLLSDTIPVGFTHNTDKRRSEVEMMYGDQVEATIIDHGLRSVSAKPLPDTDLKKEVFSQLGSLGGGNHFLEIQVDDEGYLWIMVHSGSRNIGKKIAEHFDSMAETLNELWYSNNYGIPFLPVYSDEGQEYIKWMGFALDFASLNRRELMRLACNCFKQVFPMAKFTTNDVVEDCDHRMITIHHNFAALENHHGRNVWVHRKGATKADKDLTGIIPGSMETQSFIVKGLGNHLSLNSCSHGSGRKIGRKQFNLQNADLVDVIRKRLSDKGILHSDFGKVAHGKDKGMFDLSETGEAYKDIVSVIESEKDLVEVLVHLVPKISIKG